MSFGDHIDAIKKEMNNVSSQLAANKADMERGRQEVAQLQLNLQQVNQDPAAQQELQKAHDTSKRLQEIAMKFLQLIQDPQQAATLAVELEQIANKGQPQTPQIPGMPQMMNAAVAAMQQPHMLMRNPMLAGINSPRVPGKGGVPNGAAGGMNGMNSMMQQMQMQAMAAQVQAQAHAMAQMQAQMFQGMPMMVPGMMGGMPPGMAGLPGMMPPNSMAAMQQQYAQQMAAAAAASAAVSTPSRNPSTSGHASRTRTPLTQSATNSPRPTTQEPTIKEEDPESENVAIATATVTTTAPSIKQEENTTVAVA